MMLFVMTAFSQQIYGVRVSTMADGMFEQMYGSIKVSGNVVNGMKDGAWVETHPNTELPHYIIHFKEDEPLQYVFEHEGSRDFIYDKLSELIKMKD